MPGERYDDLANDSISGCSWCNSDATAGHTLCLGLLKSSSATKLLRIAETCQKFLGIDTLPNCIDGTGLKNFDRIL